VLFRSGSLLRRRVSNRQAAKRFLDDVFRRDTPSAGPNLQRNGVPFNQRGDLCGGQRHRKRPIAVVDLKEEPREPAFFAPFSGKMRKKLTFRPMERRHMGDPDNKLSAPPAYATSETQHNSQFYDTTSDEF
jgi:hypothetical protein